MSRIVLYCALEPGSGAGGVEQFALGLVWGLGQLTDGDEEYVVVSGPKLGSWLDGRLAPNQRSVVLDALGTVAVREPSLSPAVIGRRIARFGFTHVPGALAVKVRPWSPLQLDLARVIDDLSPDVVHFPFQVVLPVKAPTVFEPHDLQHLHYPEFFSRSVLRYRRGWYPLYSSLATVVMASSQWIKDDLVQRLDVPPSKIRVVWTGSTTEAYAAEAPTSGRQLRVKYELPDRFCFYPAQTWPHKNHARLLEAVAAIREGTGERVRLVCTGRRDPSYWPALERKLHELNLAEQVRFLDFVPEADLLGIYAAADFVVIPTLFESSSLPMLEAFHLGTPVVSSNVTSLPEQGGDAVALFDPTSVDDIARVMLMVHSDDALRKEMALRSTERAREFSWERAARTYRAIYRWLQGVALSPADAVLLERSGR